MIDGYVSRIADGARRGFDGLGLPRRRVRLDGASVVGVLGGLTGFVAARQSAFLSRDCGELPIQLARLEVTFSTSRFAGLLGAAGECGGNVAWSFITWDALFPFCYALFLSALYIWTERWRRFDTNDRPRETSSSVRRDFVVVAPLAAGVLDLVGENLPLWYAADAILADPAALRSFSVLASVAVGSLAALLKWVLLLFFVVGFAVELLSPPRGAVLWRVRFSVLAVVLGAVPLLAVAQGQDILQRLFEGDHPAVRLAAAVPPLLFAAAAVWYCSRKLLELRFGTPVRAGTNGGWYDFFAEQVPRVLGIVLLVLGGTAFARAGLAPIRFLVVGLTGFFVALLVRRHAGRLLARAGRPFLPRSWRSVDGLDERVGRLLLAAVLGVLVFWPHWLPGEQGCPSMFCSLAADERTVMYLRVAAYLCLVSAWALHLVVRFRRAARHVRMEAGGAATESAHPAVDSQDPYAIGAGLKLGVAAAAAISLFWLVAFTMSPVGVGRAVGPLWILSLATANAVFIGSMTVWIGRRYRVPVVTAALLLAAMFSQWNDNHVVRTLDASHRGDVERRPSIEAHLDEWLKDLPRSGPDGRIPVILVAGQGGGLRAAYWTAMSLATIQDGTPSFARHVFAISGVSGGSLGGALFTALVRDARNGADLDCPAPPGPVAPDPRHVYSTCVRSFMRDDFLSPVLAKLVAPDLLQWFLPFPVLAFDRSLGLERSWEASYESITRQPTFAAGFAGLTADRAVRSTLPALLMNSTHVETGRRYIAASVVRDAGSGERHRLHDARDVLDVLGTDLPLSTAIHNSARFTYVSPAGHLDRGDGSENGRVVDGGYFENSGLATLGEIYDVVRTRADITPIVLYLCNDPTPCVRETAGAGTDRFDSTVADELLAPVRALLRTREARGSLARASLRALARDYFLQLNVCDSLPRRALARIESVEGTIQGSRVEQARQRVVAPPLGWLLSKLARDWMDTALTGTEPDAAGSCYARNADAIQRLRDVLE